MLWGSGGAQLRYQSVRQPAQRTAVPRTWASRIRAVSSTYFSGSTDRLTA